MSIIIGKGAKKFYALMNMPPPQIPTTFTKDARPITEHFKVIEKRIYVKCCK